MEKEVFIFPTSFAQQRLWFLHQLEPRSSVYNMPVALRLTGPLNVAALEQSLNEIMRRHEALRTTFSDREGQPVQVIAPSLTVTLPVVDLQELSGTDRDAQVRQLTTDEAKRPFDLAQGPLLRSILLRLEAQEHILLLTMHHIASDGWSMGVFRREMAELYKAFSQGRVPVLAELPIQYADFAVWQRGWLQGEVLEAQLAYWKKQLDGVAPLPLPTNRPRPPVQTFRGQAVVNTLGSELTNGLRALSRCEGVTLFMTLLSAFQALLHRYTGQTDIAVGSPIANRNRAEIEGLIGFFVNSLVMRTDLSRDPSFRELLGRVREVTLGAYAHQDLPFEKLVEELQPERDLSRNPIFQVTFALQNAPRSEFELHGLAVERFGVENRTTRFDLEVYCWETLEGLVTLFVYNTDLFDGGTIERMQRHFQTLLEGIVADPEQRLSDLRLMSEAERHQLLIEWNATKTAYPKDKCIHELFEAQVKRTPDAVAVVFEEEQLTYRELNLRANQLAHYLRKLGVGPEVLVGICVERSLEMVIGLLGILKAGGAYVPLDPEYPKERLAFMLQDTQAPVLITQQRLISMLPDHSARTVCLDTDWQLISQENEDNLVSASAPDNLAYVIYTSGSTGRPKGVAIQHRSTATLAHWAREIFSPEDISGVLASTSICFDLSVFEIFFPLSRGGTVILAKSALDLPTLQTAGKVTLVNTVPSAIAELVRANDLPASVRTVCLAGEPLSTRLVQQIYQQQTVRKVFDLYGPSEDTTYSTFTLRSATGRATIGRPIADTQIYILSPCLGPVPIGVSGEIYIGGDGLARGYLNQPELTAEKFIPDPFSNDPKARLYKTGDLARYLPDGNIEFLGRIDNQVKIRGFRIELGEIETALSQHPAVRETVVLARDEVENPKSEIRHSKSPGKRLMAYVIPKLDLSPSTIELRSFLKEKLPDYMVPSSFVFLDAFPLTPNGKVDRRALPAPDQSRPEVEQAFVAPGTPVEEVLAGIWAEVLKLEKVGIHDNFFDLGGHSLLAAQIVSRLREAFHQEIPLRSLFEAPTVAELAERIEVARQGPLNLTPSPLLPLPCEKENPLSFPQQRFWFLSQLEPDSFAYNNTYGFRLTGALNIEALEGTLGEIVRRHEALRTTFSMRNGGPVQVVAEQWQVKLPIIDLTELPNADLDAEVQRLFENEFRLPFNLSSDLMLRATLLRLNDQEHVLFLTIHHIAFDHWSIEVLYRELSLIYKAFSAGRPCPLPELPIQYRHYAIWQRQMFRDAALEDHLAYWKQQLSDSPPVLHLPSDYPRPSIQTFSGASQALVLPKALAGALKALSRGAGTSLFMTLLAAFKVLLYRLTGQDDIVVGSPIAGRDRSETENLIGLFLNTLVLRTNLSGDPTFRELLTRVREVALGAYDHRDLPFEKLLEELKSKRDLSRTPLFQAFFNMYNFEDAKLDLHGLTVSRLEISEPVSNFDLTLYVRERDDATRLILVYNADLFESATIIGMLGYYRTLLEGIVQNPDSQISNYPLLTEEERKQVSTRGNSVRPTNPFIEFRNEDIERSISSRFEQQMQQHPDHIAVRTRNHQWSYKELNLIANRVAHTVLRSCDGEQNRIGLLLEHDAPMVAAMLGALKAGKAYVPLEPAYPTERLAYMLEDSQVAAILTDSGNHAYANALGRGEIRVISMDATEPSSAIPNPGLPISPDTLAYILYTSGSTGRPKGVMQNHRNVLHHIRNYTNNLHLHSDDRLTLLSSYSFDAAVMDIFGALLNGATLYPMDLKDEDRSTLLARMIEEKITIYHSTPIVYRYLMGSLTGNEDLSAIRFIVLGGEEVQKKDVDLFRGYFPLHSIFVNGLGPTESTLALQYLINHETQITGNTVPVGHPVEHTEILLLTQTGNPTEVFGEIAIRSDHLALGYWQKPEMTAAAFLPDPDGGGKRIYRTGDMGRLLSDGSIAFVWRRDFQVKIRGFRIELGEIEATLSQHPAVRETVVVALQDVKNAECGSPIAEDGNKNPKSKIQNLKSVEKRLVAYLVAKREPAPTASELRNFLTQRLPEYMAPSVFVFLDALPLTPNGKVDRRALPAPSQSRLELREAFVAPRTSAEKALAGIWAEVLKLEKVGTHDDFFDLGGHSLLATQVISRVRTTFQIVLPLRILFEKPTIEELAAVIIERQAEGAGQENLARMMIELEALSDEEAEQLLAGKCTPQIIGDSYE